MKGHIECLVCGNKWDWVDCLSFRRCECGNLYVIGHSDAENTLLRNEIDYRLSNMGFDTRNIMLMIPIRALWTAIDGIDCRPCIHSDTGAEKEKERKDKKGNDACRRACANCGAELQEVQPGKWQCSPGCNLANEYNRLITSLVALTGESGDYLRARIKEIAGTTLFSRTEVAKLCLECMRRRRPLPWD